VARVPCSTVIGAVPQATSRTFAGRVGSVGTAAVDDVPPPWIESPTAMPT
jgi:hypothetical protein